MTDELPDHRHPRESMKNNTTDAIVRLCRSCAITRHTAIAAKASIAHRRQMRRGLGIESCIDSIAYERGIADGLIAVLKTAIISYHSDIEDPDFYFTIGDEQMVKDAVDALFVRPEEIDE